MRNAFKVSNVIDAILSWDCHLREYVSCSNCPVSSDLLMMPVLYAWRSIVIVESIHEIHFKLMAWLAFGAIDTTAIMSFIDEFRLYCERGSGLLVKRPPPVGDGERRFWQPSFKSGCL